MNTLEYLFDPTLRGRFWPPVLAALVISQVCAAVSPLVVLRRLAFIGQGVSHSAFAGAGLAFLLAALGVMGPPGGWGAAPGLTVIVLLVAIAAACGIRALEGRRAGTPDAAPGGADTAIGIVLAVAMALGFVLHGVAARLVAGNGGTPVPEVESVLFGSILAARWGDVWLAVVAGIVVGAALFVTRRDLWFWAVDPQGSRTFGVRDRRMQLVLLLTVSVAVVATMQLVGVVLATALVVLPGAIALRLSDRLGTVLVLSHAIGFGATLAGMVLSFELALPSVGEVVLPGPAVVFVLAAFYGVAVLVTRRTRGGSASPGEERSAATPE